MIIATLHDSISATIPIFKTISKYVLQKLHSKLSFFFFFSLHACAEAQLAVFVAPNVPHAEIVQALASCMRYF